MGLDDDTLRRVQARLLEMAGAITTVLERDGIPYCLAFGTLLGAVRHGGFIPWDDDFDLFLFDDSYDEALASLRSGLPDDMFVEWYDSEPLYFHSWAHVKDLRSVAECSAYPQDGAYAHKGISVDLYRYVRMRAGEVEGFIARENCSYVKRRRSFGLMGEDEAYGRLSSSRSFDFSNGIKAHTSVLAFPSPYKCKCHMIDEVLPFSHVAFEGGIWSAPGNSEQVLRDLYGDWTVLPPHQERRSHYDGVFFL